MKKIYNILLIAIALIVISIITPFGLNQPTPASGYFNDSICFDCNNEPDTFILSLLIILIPIIIFLGIIVLFYPSKKFEKKDNEKNTV